jgi:hypothetical protein
MKYFLFLVAAVASLGLAPAKSSSTKAADCCPGGACCGVKHGCCHAALK